MKVNLACIIVDNFIYSVLLYGYSIDEVIELLKRLQIDKVKYEIHSI